MNVIIAKIMNATMSLHYVIIPLEPTLVPVEMVSLEMALTALVSHCGWWCCVRISCSIDINECVMGHDCHDNAGCFNTLGSYNCTCIPGFTGNGTYCTGIFSLLFPLISV